MIHFDDSTRVFELRGRRSFYAFQADGDGRVVHLGWGAVAPGFDGPVASGTLPVNVLPAFGLDRQGRRDEVLTFGDTTYQEVTLKVAFASLPGELGADEAWHGPMRDVRLRYVGHSIDTDARPGQSPNHGQPTRVTSPRSTLRLHLADPLQPLRVNACYRLTPEHDIVERWLELENTGSEPIVIEQLFFASVHLHAGRWELTHAAGAWAAETHAERHPLPAGQTVLESRSVHTGFVHSPQFLLNEVGRAGDDAGLVYFGQLAWSGAWRLAFEQRPNGALIAHGGYNPFDFALRLDAGARHVTPSFLLGCADDGWNGASRRQHALLRERVLPLAEASDGLRPVLYNSWEATYFNLSHDGQLELARRAAAIGVELFCVDDGWFGGRRGETAGLGDWHVSPDVFPNGLAPLIAAVHDLGMRFGLWVEPEMVNRDSDLYRAHPDWVLHFPGRPRTEERHQLILDFGRSEVVAYIENQLDVLLQEHAIDFLKWDMNRSSTEPGSCAGREIWLRHAEAVYGIMDRLRRRHPRLHIESCSSGGGRIDAGILARTEQVWTSDNTDALTRVAIQEGYSLAYPALAMACWVTHERNHQTQRRLPLDLRFHVAMRGALGIGSNLAELSDDELADYGRWIAFYKSIRPVVQLGECHRLQRLAEHGTSIVQYVTPDGTQAVVSCVAIERRVAQLVPPARLRGLRPEAVYVARDRDGNVHSRARGVELMSLGFEPNLGIGWYGPGYAATLHLVAE